MTLPGQPGAYRSPSGRGIEMRVGPLGITEILIILVVILLIFGARRLPEIGSSMGKGIRTFKSALLGEDEKKADDPPMAKGRDDSSPY